MEFKETGEQVVQRVRAMTPTVLLSFSCGKDSVAAWLAIREHLEVIPFYLYQVPDLESVNESIAYYEQQFGVHIQQFPHPSMNRQLNNYVYQPPDDGLDAITELNLIQYDYRDVEDTIRDERNLPAAALCATGIRASDSVMRSLYFQKHGAVSENKGKFHPVFDWNKARVISEIKRSGIKLAKDYRIYGRTFDGMEARFLVPLKQHYPADYRKVLEWFPLAELEVRRYEARAQL